MFLSHCSVSCTFFLGNLSYLVVQVGTDRWFLLICHQCCVLVITGLSSVLVTTSLFRLMVFVGFHWY